MVELISLHVPKCAGDSLLDALRRIYGGSLFVDYERDKIMWPDSAFNTDPVGYMQRVPPEAQKLVAGQANTVKSLIPDTTPLPPTGATPTIIHSPFQNASPQPLPAGNAANTVKPLLSDTTPLPPTSVPTTANPPATAKAAVTAPLQPLPPGNAATTVKPLFSDTTPPPPTGVLTTVNPPAPAKATVIASPQPLPPENAATTVKPLLSDTTPVPPKAAPSTAIQPAPVKTANIASPQPLPAANTANTVKPLPAVPTTANPQSPFAKETTPAPVQTLSAESKKALETVARHSPPPSSLAPNASNSSIDIDHSNKITSLDKLADTNTQTSSHESAGIKVEVKAPKMNLDYELEKAYNASVAGQSEEAIAIYRNVLDSDPRNKNALFGLATTYHRVGQVALARPLYATLLAIDPNNRDGLNNFLALIAEEAPQEALTQLQQLQRLNESYSPIPAQMAIIYQKLGQFDHAVENMRHAIELAPENLTYRYNFAVMLDTQHQYAEAIEMYRQIIQAYQRGELIPGNIEKIQQRLTFISSNRH